MTSKKTLDQFKIAAAPETHTGMPQGAAAAGLLAGLPTLMLSGSRYSPLVALGAGSAAAGGMAALQASSGERLDHAAKTLAGTAQGAGKGLVDGGVSGAKGGALAGALLGGAGGAFLGGYSGGPLKALGNALAGGLTGGALGGTAGGLLGAGIGTAAGALKGAGKGQAQAHKDSAKKREDAAKTAAFRDAAAVYGVEKTAWAPLIAAGARMALPAAGRMLAGGAAKIAPMAGRALGGLKRMGPGIAKDIGIQAGLGVGMNALMPSAPPPSPY